MATLSKGYSFGATESVTAAKLHSLVDSATIASIATADIANSAVTDAKIASVGGSKITSLTDVPAGAGVIPAVNLEAAAWTDYSATSTIVGWSSFSTKLLYIKKIGKTVFVSFQLEGTSNTGAATFTLPMNVSNSPSFNNFSILAKEAGTDVSAALGYTIAGNNVITLVRDLAGTGWVNSGTKIVRGQFFCEVE